MLGAESYPSSKTMASARSSKPLMYTPRPTVHRAGLPRREGEQRRSPAHADIADPRHLHRSGRRVASDEEEAVLARVGIPDGHVPARRPGAAVRTADASRQLRPGLADVPSKLRQDFTLDVVDPRECGCYVRGGPRLCQQKALVAAVLLIARHARRIREGRIVGRAGDRRAGGTADSSQPSPLHEVGAAGVVLVGLHFEVLDRCIGSGAKAYCRQDDDRDS